MNLSTICGMLLTGHSFHLHFSRPPVVTSALNFSVICHCAGVKHFIVHRRFARAIYIELLHTYMYVHKYIIFCPFFWHTKEANRIYFLWQKLCKKSPCRFFKCLTFLWKDNFIFYLIQM